MQVTITTPGANPTVQIFDVPTDSMVLCLPKDVLLTSRRIEGNATDADRYLITFERVKARVDEPA